MINEVPALLADPRSLLQEKRKKEIRTKFGLEGRFLVKRLFNSLNEGAELEAFLLTTTGALNCRRFSEITFAFQRRRMQLVSDSLSYAEAPLCRIETGEREKGNREGSGGKAFFLFPSSTVRSEVFNYCCFYRNTQRKPPRRRESPRSHSDEEVKDYLNMILFVI